MVKRIYITVEEEEFKRLKELKGVFKTWKQFLVDPILREGKGISPVIATIIIVAVSITIAIAAAYWVSGVAGLFTRFEKVEVPYIYAAPAGNGWDLKIKIRNTGASPVTIDSIFINNQPYQYQEVRLDVGGETEISLLLRREDGFKPGVAVEVRLHSAAGNEYFKTVILP